MKKPYFLMTFANDKSGSLLRGVAKERDAISEALQPIVELCELKFVASINTEKLVKELCEKKPTIFHYGGHAEGEVLFFNSEKKEGVEAKKLSDFLAHFDGIELVFLNGCATVEFRDQLLAAGVRHVITTHTNINDKVAVEFARHFYQKLGNGAAIPESFEFAEAAVRLGLGIEGEGARGFSTPGYWRDNTPDEKAVPWHIANSSHKEKSTPWRWQEPEEIAIGSVVSGRKGGEGLHGVSIRRGTLIDTNSDREGKFELKLKYSWLGTKIEIDAKKPQFEVVNLEALTIFPEKDRNPQEKLVEIIMCPEGKRGVYALEYYSITMHESIRKRDGTFQEKNNISEFVPAIADQLKGMKINDTLDQTLKAIKYLGKGKVNEAIEALKEEELFNEFENIKSQEAELKTRKKKLLEALFLKASTLILAGKFEEAESCYQRAIEIAPNEFSVLNKYLKFLFKQNQFQKGKEICDNSLSRVQENENKSALLKSNFLHQQGRFFWRSNEYATAKGFFEEALIIRRALVAKNLKLKEKISKKIKTLEVGILENQDLKETEARMQFQELLRLKNELRPKEYADLLAATLNNLGILYMEEHSFEKAENYLSESLNIDVSLAERDPEKYGPYKATNLMNLGMMYMYQQKFSLAEKNYKAALDIYRELVLVDSYKYEPKLAKTLLQKGNCFTKQKEFDIALPIIEEALEIHKNRYELNPIAYRPILSESYHRLGKLFHESNKLEKAKSNFELSLQLREELCKEAPEAYLDEYAATLNNMGRLYHDLNEFEKSEACYKKSIELDKKLIKNNNEVYLVYYLFNLNDLAYLYASNKKKKEAKGCYEKAIEVYKSLPENSLEDFKFDLAYFEDKVKEK